MKSEIRILKFEISLKAQRPEIQNGRVLQTRRLGHLDFENSNLFRISKFELRAFSGHE